MIEDSGRQKAGKRLLRTHLSLRPPYLNWDVRERPHHRADALVADIRSYARPLPISISTLMRSLPLTSNLKRRDRTSSRTARRSVAGRRR